MLLKIIPFIIITLVVVFGSHFFVYFTLIRFFGVTRFLVKVVFFAGLAALAVSFILASIYSHFSDNIVSRLFYLLSASWYGLLVNFVIVSIIIWLIYGLTNYFGIQYNRFFLAVFFFVLATAWSFYGTWNAFLPRIKNITVAVKNLPAAWQGQKIVQLSDVHLGHIYRRDFLEQVISKVNEQKPAAVFFTGDLFDGMDGNLSGFIQPLNNIEAPLGVYFVTGNHETYLGFHNALKILEQTKIKVLQDELVNVDGLQIIGLSYGGEGNTKNVKKIIESLSNFDNSQPSVLLYHVPVGIKEAKESGINLQISGHTHRGQLFPFMLITRLVYGRYDYGFRTEADFNLYTSSGLGTWGPPMRTGSNSEIVVITLVNK